MSENILQRTLKKFRPGSGGPAKAISIIDGQTGRAPSIPMGIRGNPLEDDGEDFDDEKSGMPIALALHYGAGPKDQNVPTGDLAGIDKNGNIPSYAPDDSTILYRLFGHRISDD